MNYICSWLYADPKGDESVFPQTGEISSSQTHQDIYWRCIVVFYTTSKYLNPNDKHLFFTNSDPLPNVDGLELSDFFRKLDIEVIRIDLTYKTPKGYYFAWQNTFYEFSIMKYIGDNYDSDKDNFLILDSDCIFLKPATSLFKAAEDNNGFLSYILNYDKDKKQHGLSRREMKSVYEELQSKKINEIPEYHGGELFLSNLRNIKKINSGFQELWPALLDRNEKKLLKFNTEEPALSYLFYINNLKGGGANKFIKRIWTNPVFNRNVNEGDQDLMIWHLPAEKKLGFKRLFGLFRKDSFVISKDQVSYLKFICRYLGIPRLSVQQHFNYYLSTGVNFINKKIRNESSK